MQAPQLRESSMPLSRPVLRPTRRQCLGRSDTSSTQSPQTRPSSKVVFSSVLWPGVRGGGSEGREGRQQSLWLSERSVFSFLCPCTPWSLLLLLRRLVSCHRKLSSARSLQSRHISSNKVMSSRVSPSRLA